MKEMSLKTFPLKWTLLFGFTFLGATLYSCIVHKADVLLLSLLPDLAFLVSGLSSIGILVADRTRINFYRVLVNGLFLVLFVPAARLGNDIKDQLFLRDLPRYQEVVDLLINIEKEKSAVFDVDRELPSKYLDLPIRNFVNVSRDSAGICTVMFFDRDSSALGHGGYLYRSDDNPAPLRKIHSQMGYGKIAPKWYLWGD